MRWYWYLIHFILFNSPDLEISRKFDYIWIFVNHELNLKFTSSLICFRQLVNMVHLPLKVLKFPQKIAKSCCKVDSIASFGCSIIRFCWEFLVKPIARPLYDHRECCAIIQPKQYWDCKPSTTALIEVSTSLIFNRGELLAETTISSHAISACLLLLTLILLSWRK